MSFEYTLLDSSDDFVRAVESTIELFKDAFSDEPVGRLTIENSLREEGRLIGTKFCYVDADDNETDWYIESVVPEHTFQTDIAAKRRLVCCHVEVCISEINFRSCVENGLRVVLCRTIA